MVEIKDLIVVEQGYGNTLKFFNKQTRQVLPNTSENRARALFALLLQERANVEPAFPSEKYGIEQFAKDYEECLKVTLRHELFEGSSKVFADILLYTFNLNTNVLYTDLYQQLISSVLQDQRNPGTRTYSNQLTHEFYYLEEENIKMEQEKLRLEEAKKEQRPIKYKENYGYGYRLFDTVTGQYVENTPKNRTKALFCELLSNEAKKDSSFPNQLNNVENLANDYEDCLAITISSENIGKTELYAFLTVLSNKFGLDEKMLKDENFQRLVYDILIDQQKLETQTHAETLAKTYANYQNEYQNETEKTL